MVPLSLVLWGALTAAGETPPAPGLSAVLPHFVQSAAPAGGFVARSGALSVRVDRDALRVRLDGAGGQAASVALRFLGARDDAEVVGEGSPSANVHRYTGRPAAPVVLAAHESVRIRGLYAGVDVRVLRRQGRLAWDVLLAPGVDPSVVRVRCEGVPALRLEDERLLVADTAVGPLVQPLPAAWQTRADGGRTPVAARFVLLGDDTFGFDVPGRDPAFPLVIDPGLEYGTFLGGMFLDRAYAVARMPDGDVVLAGLTFSPDFPDTPGAFQGDLAGETDAFVARIDLSSGTLVFATYLGGVDSDPFVPEAAYALAVASDGTLLVAGDSNSEDFPTTAGVLAENRPGGTDVFVARLSGTGQLVWSTYLGGTGNDRGRALAVDGVGRPVLAGLTFSADFPSTPGAFDTSFNSIFFTDDAFVARLAADGSVLEWASYLGGSLRDEAFGVAADEDGSVVVAGLTGSVDFPATPASFDPTYNGSNPTNTDAFVARLSPSGDTLVWATYFGGAGVVEGRALALAPVGRARGATVSDVVLGGLTRSGDLPTTAGVLQPTFAGGTTDGFLARLSANGSNRLWAGYLGGSGEDRVHAVATLPSGLVTVVGSTTSPDFPVRSGGTEVLLPGGGGRPPQTSLAKGGQPPAPGGLPPPAPLPEIVLGVDTSLGGAQDAYLVRVSANGSDLFYGSFVGGSDGEEGLALMLDDFGAAYVAGETSSPDLPVTALAVDATHGGVGDAFLVKRALPPFASLDAVWAGPTRLLGTGSLEPGTPFGVHLTGAPPLARSWLAVSFGEGALPFAGGWLLAWPPVLVAAGRTDPAGALTWHEGSWPFPAGGAPRLVLQSWSEDLAAPAGFRGSNGLELLAR